MTARLLIDTAPAELTHTSDGYCVNINGTTMGITDFTALWLQRMIRDDYTVFDADTETKFDAETSDVIRQVSYHKEDYWQQLSELISIDSTVSLNERGINK